jgi:DNA-directed RNA polymerase specialized sigma24 family protein
MGPDAEDSFEEFVRGRSTHLFRLAVVLTGWNEAAAQDLLQIALERAYRRRWLLFRQGGSAEPYVRRVLVTRRSTGGGCCGGGENCPLTWPRRSLRPGTRPGR